MPIPHHINIIGKFARNFTIDNTSFFQWKSNMLKSTKSFKSKLTKYFNKKSTNSTNINNLKIAYKYLDKKINNLIPKGSEIII